LRGRGAVVPVVRTVLTGVGSTLEIDLTMRSRRTRIHSVAPQVLVKRFLRLIEAHTNNSIRVFPPDKVRQDSVPLSM
jgi:hypothetical protein